MDAKIVNFGHHATAEKAKTTYKGIFLTVWGPKYGIYPLIGYNTEDESEWLVSGPSLYTDGSGYIRVIGEQFLPPWIFLPLIDFQRDINRYQTGTLEIGERILFAHRCRLLKELINTDLPWDLKNMVLREGLNMSGRSVF